MLTKEELENYLAELKKYAESGDPECAHVVLMESYVKSYLN